MTAAILSEEVGNALREQLKALTGRVRLLFFTQQHACGACADQERLLRELTRLSDKLALEVHELTGDQALAKRFRVDKVPATVLLGGDTDYGIRFFGLTGGYEFASLLEAIRMISSGHSGLEAGVESMVQRISLPTHLEIMVTLTCPYCPSMVRLAHQMAFVNEHVRADMVDASEFPTLVQRYQVRGVPRTVVNERPAFEGALPAADAVLAIAKAADPAAYEALDAARREAGGERRALEAREGERYDVIVVGAGPAGLAAALYAVRKNHRVALVGRKLGGQIADTAIVENYPGIARIGGQELAEQFRHQLEAYPVAERCHTEASQVRRGADGGFEVVTSDRRVYRGKSVIYAAGKEYRRLDVAGESRFIGRGIAFCATCDAPLYRDKRVAVIGGGNSALTAVRDLLPFAREIHLIHALESFQADAVLVAEVRRAPRVRIHMKTEVREFLGGDALAGVRVVSAEGAGRYDIEVDGVFLEIGLTPNTAPVHELITLSAQGEIPVDREQASAVPGLFAAGDVTDEPDKQIVVAAAAGARAALAADRYLTQLGRPGPALSSK